MDPVLAIIIGGSLLFLYLFLVKIPHRTWKFEHAGHQIVIKNYSLHEVIYLNGEQIKETKVSSFNFTAAEHKLLLPSGEEINIYIETDGTSVFCQALSDETLLFDSQERKRKGKKAQSITPKKEDPRLVAANTLLDELFTSRTEDVIESSKQLRSALHIAFDRLEKSKRSMEAYKAIDPVAQPELEKVVAEHEAKLQQLLKVVKDLHYTVTKDSADDIIIPDDVQNVLLFLKAEQEVNDTTSILAFKR